MYLAKQLKLLIKPTKDGEPEQLGMALGLGDGFPIPPAPPRPRHRFLTKTGGAWVGTVAMQAAIPDPCRKP